MRRSKGWYKPKGYLHISPKLRKNDESSVLDYIKTKLSQHNFFPLVHETISTRRYKKLANGERSHFDYVSAKSKPTAKDREIFYANHLDAHIYSYFANEVLGPKYESRLKEDKELDSSVIAYRRIPVSYASESNKCNIDFAKEVFDEVKSRGNCFVVCYDIENFFPSLDHDYLKKCWCGLFGTEKLDDINYKIFKSITAYSFVELQDLITACSNPEKGLLRKHHFINAKPKLKSYFPEPKEFRKRIAAKKLIKTNPKDKTTGERKGIPQGTPISAFLANLYLLDFDIFMIEELVKKENCFYRRYSDDIIIVFSDEIHFRKWDSRIRETLSVSPFHLIINEGKTVVSKFEIATEGMNCSTKIQNSLSFSSGVPLRYLGFDFDGKKITIKDASLSAYYRDMKQSLRAKGNRVKASKYFNSKNPEKQPKDTKLYLTNLMKRFTHLGKNKAKSNFLTYVERAARAIYPKAKNNDNPISGQVKRSWSIFTSTANRFR
jgi:hypothetical protein